MNTVQVNKSRMYHTTDGVLDANQGLFARLDELTAAHLKFKGFLVKIRDYRQVQEADQSGLTETKAILRGKLGTLTLKCISALKAHGVATQDEVLLGKVNYSKSKVGKLKDPVFADVAHLILTEAQGRLAELSKFFVTEEDLAEMQVLETEFRAAMPRKRIADSVSKVSTQNIAEIFDAVDQLLKEELDVLMAPFGFTEPDFFPGAIFRRQRFYTLHPRGILASVISLLFSSPTMPLSFQSVGKARSIPKRC